MTTQAIAVQFHNQSLTAAIIDSIPYVAMKPICENIGLQWDGQMQRIKRHPVLSSTACMTHVVAEDGKLREMLMLPIKYLNGWLFGVDTNRVKEGAREKLIDYQRECFDVLANHFMPLLDSQVQLSPEKLLRLEQSLKTQKALILQIAKSDEQFTVTEAAKLLSIGPQTLYKILKDVGWIYRCKSSRKWLANQRKIKSGYLTQKFATSTDSEGTDRIRSQVIITGKGVICLRQSKALDVA